jgi:hypothetical protein
MNSLSHQFAPPAAPLVSETASTSVPATPTPLAAQAPAAPPTPALTESPTPTPTSLDAPSVSGSISDGTPSPVAELVARLQYQDVEIVETALLRFKEACCRGDQSFIEEALIEQATLLNAVGLRMLDNAADAKVELHVQLWTNLGLRSIEIARKSLETLISTRSRANRQTNVQVNVGVPTNELKSVASE